MKNKIELVMTLEPLQYLKGDAIGNFCCQRISVFQKSSFLVMKLLRTKETNSIF